ncbi:LPS export ABC transporter permease LptG [Thalassobius sp. Cn5-15]|uniref:LPS export ABC transporter permease LptG n=1 Tax=Thalassobius sp. Cn5-15 TaxID=2917763 RepID=UPI001EF3B616|nr:LPS export ABC transporter permease LptG [Thalassobius sp. Cn5-15]MCG7492300.1 LPS export ABC transporter permease LptG [Thalassobius sp. Cn5-15]
MKLDFYFARKFAVLFAGIFGVFFLLMTLIDLVEQISRFSARGVSFANIAELTLLNAPKGLYDIFPLVMILTTISLFLGLARSSELVVARASGRSALRSLLSPLLVATLIGVIAVAVFNPIVAATSKRYEILYESYSSGNAQVFSISGEGLWLRQGDEDGQAVIRASRADPAGSVFYDVTFLTYSATGGPISRIEAEAATLERGAWVMRNAKRWTLGDQNPESTAEQLAELTLPSNLTQERIRDSFGQPSTISIWDLPSYIGQLEEAGFSARRHAVWLQRELARPLFLVAMVMIASAFTMRHSRFGRTGLAVLASIMLGFTLYYIRNFAQILGENGQISIYLAAWAPPVASVMLALGLLLHMEDG